MNYHSGVLYSKNNFELSYSLQNICKQNKINFFLVSRFSVLMEHLLKCKPTFLFLDYTTVDCSEEVLSIFNQCDQISPEHVIVIQNDGDNLYSLSKHYIMFTISHVSSCLSNQIKALLDDEKFSIQQKKNNNIDAIKVNQMLDKFGFSPKYLGSIYLKEVLNEILRDKSAIKSLNTLIYPKIALRYNTTNASVERNIRTAVINALYNIKVKNISIGVQLNGVVPSNKKVVSFLINQFSCIDYAE